MIVVALADLSEQNGSGPLFNRKIVIKALRDKNTFSGCQAYLRARGNCICFTVCMNGYVTFVVDLFIFKSIVHSYQNVSATAVDNILCFIPMEMVESILSLFEIQKLFRIRL